MADSFDEATRVLLDGKNFAVVATLNPDGGPQTSVVWIAREGDAIMTMRAHLYDRTEAAGSRT
jgi:hypothetical protein